MSLSSSFCRSNLLLSSRLMAIQHQLPAAALFLSSTAYLILCPYSKVEESFNFQAVYDCFYVGVSPAILSFYTQNPSSLPYDHLQYPGVVPRTFLGPFLVSWACRLAQLIVSPFHDLAEDPTAVRFLARFFLLLLTVSQWHGMAVALEKRCAHAGAYLLLVTACQFHLPFYASRFLPNSLATILTLRSFTHWLRRTEMAEAAVDMVLAASLVRCDCILLLFTCGLSWLVTRQLTVVKAVVTGIATVLVGWALTVPLDSALWQRWTWPEGEVLFFNTLQNKSSEWGVSVWHWYWTAALPKALLLTLLCIPLSIIRLPESIASWREKRRVTLFDWTWAEFLLPALGFVGLYSALGHKEVRFLFPALPLFNLSAAVGLSRLHRAASPLKSKRPSLLSRILYVGGLGTLAVSWMASTAFVAVSRHNYPGGVALERLVDYLIENPDATKASSELRIHVDVASAMTGVSLWEQRAAQKRLEGYKIVFDKGGYEDENAVEDFSRYTHLLTEQREVPKFTTVSAIQGHPKLDLRRLRVITQNAIYIQERN